MGTTCLVDVWVVKLCQTLLQLPSKRLCMALSKLKQTTKIRPINPLALAAFLGKGKREIIGENVV